jgi:hypothetical protein
MTTPACVVIRNTPCDAISAPTSARTDLTIHPAPGLKPSERRRAARLGPVAVSSSRPQAELLGGLRRRGETDCTAEFAKVTRAWLEQYDAHRAELVDLIGEALFEERQADRRGQLRAIEEGLLRRSELVGTRPGRLTG